jgi:hypothetical protein
MAGAVNIVHLSMILKCVSFLFQELVLQGLDPYTWYMVSILAYNDQGDGPPRELAVQTLEGRECIQIHVLT